MQNQSLTFAATGSQDNTAPSGAWNPVKMLGDGRLWTAANLLANNSSGDPINLQVVALDGDAVPIGFYPGVATYSPGYAFNGTTTDRLRSQGNDASAVATNATGVLKVASFEFGFNGTTWDRKLSQGNDANAIATSTSGVSKIAAFEYGFNGTTWDRQLSQGNEADDVATSTTGIRKTAGFLYGFDGTLWDRIRTQTNNTDGIAATSSGNVRSAGFGHLFNGATWDRARTASAAVQSAATQVGIQAVAMIGNWSITHTPAANTQATITRAAGAAGVRHVCTSISFNLSAPATATSGVVQINLRDGATGAGTILWSQTLQVGGAASIAAANLPMTISGLSIPGTAATAMTLEFSAAGGANVSESVSLTGYDVS